MAWLAIQREQSETTPMNALMPLLILGIPVMDILQVIPVRIHSTCPCPGRTRAFSPPDKASWVFPSAEVVAIIYGLEALLLGSACCAAMD